MNDISFGIALSNLAFNEWAPRETSWGLLCSRSFSVPNQTSNASLSRRRSLSAPDRLETPPTETLLKRARRSRGQRCCSLPRKGRASSFFSATQLSLNIYRFWPGCWQGDIKGLKKVMRAVRWQVPMKKMRSLLNLQTIFDNIAIINNFLAWLFKFQMIHDMSFELHME